MSQEPGSRSSRTLLHRIVRSLGGRSGYELESSSRPSAWMRFRTVPLLAVGVVAWLGVLQWSPGADPDVELPDAAVVTGMELPVEVNERVERWMQRFLTDQRGTFQVFLQREGRYAGMIRNKLRERGMPEDLLYLAMIESGFSPAATSPVSASGVWQFMGPTAREYGLRITRYVDERRDPVKATDAALDYLQYLYDRYDSWYLAAAAYNAGPTRVSRVLRRHAGGRYGDEQIYWQIINHLPRETRDYVPKILAATLLARDAEAYGFRYEASEPYSFERVWVPGSTHLSEVAKVLELPTSRIRELNPHLIRGMTPPGGSFALRVPRGKSQQVVAALGGGRWGGALADD